MGWITAASIIGPAVAGGAMDIMGANQSDSKKVAREQLRFQERMSNTAYQRSADDLEKAGLNRVLALGNSASTPSGAMGMSPDLSQIGSRAVNSARAGLEAVQNRKAREVMDSQIASNEASARAADEAARKARADAYATEMNTLYILPKQLEEADARIGQYRANSAKVFQDMADASQLFPGSKALQQILLEKSGAELSKTLVEKAGYQALLPLVRGLSEYLKRAGEDAASSAKSRSLFDILNPFKPSPSEWKPPVYDFGDK